MEFKHIPKVLKRYSFESKMKISQFYSQKSMNPFQYNINPKNNSFIPYDIETFALISAFTLNEYDNQIFENKKGNRVFQKVMQAIRKSDIPEIAFFNDNFTINQAELLMTSFALNQFSAQKNNVLKLYRYNYFFSYQDEEIDMPKEFVRKFSVPYQDFVEFGIISSFLNYFIGIESLEGSDIFKELHNRLVNNYPKVVEMLMIDREEFYKLQTQVTTDINHFIHGFKYFYQYPFIKYKGIVYYPLPHLIIENVTTAMYFRLTESNNRLRAISGKNLIEKYIYDLAKLSPFFEKVVEEYAYTIKNENRTVDLMIYQNECALLIESKSMAPRLNVRNFVDKDIEHTIDRIAEAVIQLYKHMTKRFQIEYFPFGKEKKIKKSNVYGIVLMLEDSYISKRQVMLKVAEKLKVNSDSEEYMYICSNILFMGLYAYERAILFDVPIINCLQKRIEQPEKWYDYDDTCLENINMNDKGSSIFQEKEYEMRDIYSNFIKESASIIKNF